MKTFLTAGGLLLAMAAGLPSQEPGKEQLPTITVDVDLVNVLCSVRDKRGALVANLSKEDFMLYEDGKQQEIKYFARETDLPLTIGLLVDVSVSQGSLIEEERRAAQLFFSSVLRKKDLAFLISFGSEAELLQDLTNSSRLLEQGLAKLRVRSSASGIHPGPVPTASTPRGTILYDAVYLAANEKLRAEVGRKVIVLISDGVDQGSRIRLDEAIAEAHRADTIIYGIHYMDRAFYGWFAPGGDSTLRRMSEETGGRMFRVEKRHPLAEIFDQIQQEMRSQYALGYTPTNTARDGAFRRIEIKTRDRNLKVQARRGYFARKSAS